MESNLEDRLNLDRQVVIAADVPHMVSRVAKALGVKIRDPARISCYSGYQHADFKTGPDGKPNYVMVVESLEVRNIATGETRVAQSIQIGGGSRKNNLELVYDASFPSGPLGQLKPKSVNSEDVSTVQAGPWIENLKSLYNSLPADKK